MRVSEQPGVLAQVKLHTVFVTYNRLELTKRAIESYLETVTVPHRFLVVDNASTDGTTTWLQQNVRTLNFKGIIAFPENRYAGAACNFGWAMVSAWMDVDFLQRADNDSEFLPGWCEHVEECFEGRPELGQLGLRMGEEEGFNKINVSGDCIIRRELWDKGLRWEEKPWSEYPRGTAESRPFARAVEKMGYKWDRVTQPCIRPIAAEDPDDEYYIESWRSRGILEWALKRHGR